MQLSIKPPPEFTVPIIEKCAVLRGFNPSAFAQDCVLYCLGWMDHPRDQYPRTGSIVEKYYYALGREHEISSFPAAKKLSIVRQLVQQEREKRSKEAWQQLAKLRTQLQQQPPTKHLHLKISGGFHNLPSLIKEKCVWLRLKPNALVVACLRDCLAAMDDVCKALEPPPVAVDFWAISHTKEQHKAGDAFEAMAMASIKKILVNRSGPILDTITRHALNGQWNISLKKILIEADALTEKGEYKL